MANSITDIIKKFKNAADEFESNQRFTVFASAIYTAWSELNAHRKDPDDAYEVVKTILPLLKQKIDAAERAARPQTIPRSEGFYKLADAALFKQSQAIKFGVKEFVAARVVEFEKAAAEAAIPLPAYAKSEHIRAQIQERHNAVRTLMP